MTGVSQIEGICALFSTKHHGLLAYQSTFAPTRWKEITQGQLTA